MEELIEKKRNHQEALRQAGEDVTAHQAECEALRQEERAQTAGSEAFSAHLAQKTFVIVNFLNSVLLY